MAVLRSDGAALSSVGSLQPAVDGGLVRRVSRTYRYILTPTAQQLIPAILATQRVTLQQLQSIAA
jgi:hypothetical protein